jgi:hypothetical protein
MTLILLSFLCPIFGLMFNISAYSPLGLLYVMILFLGALQEILSSNDPF